MTWLMAVLACGGAPEATVEPEVLEAAADEPGMEEEAPDEDGVADDLPVELVPASEVARRIAAPERPTVVNFWATWCGPCREEQPRLFAWAEEHPDVQMIWVSLDLAKLREAAVVPVLRKGGFVDGTVEHWQLDDPDPAMAVGRLVPTWGGTVPVTLAVDAEGAVVKTWAGMMHAEQLQELEAALAKR